MKVVKPLNLSFLHKVFEANQSFYLCGAIIGMFPFSDPELLFPDPLIWKTAGKELGKDAVLDLVMPKPVGEVLVTGRCFAGKKPVTGTTVNLRLGAINKTLTVIGDRHWVKAAGMAVNISEAEPFESLPITYENAYGGPGYALNPLGKGAVETVDARGRAVHPLPNIIDSHAQISSPEDRPQPAGFGPLDMTWPQRLPKAGTYDRQWQETLFPGLAADIDMHFFNLAPEDQWLDGYFQGDETLVVEGMHPEKASLTSKLPGLRPRMFVKQKVNDEERFFEIKTALDTVWIFPHAEKAIMIWHGTTEIGTDDATDVLAGLAAYERLKDEPRPAEHYAEALANRFDKEKKDFYDLYDRDLVPPEARSGWAALIAQGRDDDSPLSRNLMRRAEREKKKAEAARAENESRIAGLIEQYGLDPNLLPTPDTPPPTPEVPEIDLNNFDPEQILKTIEEIEARAREQQDDAAAVARAKKEAGEKALQELCEKYNLDPRQFLDKDKTRELKRPIIVAREQLDKFRAVKDQVEGRLQQAAAAMGLGIEELREKARAASPSGEDPVGEALDRIRGMDPDDPETVAKLKKAEAVTRKMYLEQAQMAPRPKSPDPGVLAERLERFEAILKAGGSFKFVDLAGIDLGGRDLSGVNLAGAYLEGANLTGARLERAVLTSAVLSYADLSEAVVSEARLQHANLGRTKLTGARFENSNLAEAVLSGADLTGARFLNCKMQEVDLFDAVLENTDFSESNLKKVTLIKAVLSGVSFKGADLSQAVFIKPKMKDVDFSDAAAKGVTFIGLKSEGLIFNRADLTNARFLSGVDLFGAGFDQAILDNANLMGAKLENASLAKAGLNQANLMGANLQGADLTAAAARKAILTKANLESARLVGADLMEANLRGARLVSADLRLANLYSAEVFRVTIGQTDFTGANLNMTKIKSLEKRWIATN